MTNIINCHTNVIHIVVAWYEMQKTEIINVRIPKEIVKKIEVIIQKNLFTSRSELIRQFLREYVSKKKEEKQ